MNKPIKSNDPRKPMIVATLKRVNGCTKVTNVRQTAEHVFTGDCMRKDGQWTHLGTREVDWTPTATQLDALREYENIHDMQFIGDWRTSLLVDWHKSGSKVVDLRCYTVLHGLRNSHGSTWLKLFYGMSYLPPK